MKAPITSKQKALMIKEAPNLLKAVKLFVLGQTIEDQERALNYSLKVLKRIEPNNFN